MKYYVATDIGCIECGEPSEILGIFTSKKEAQRVCDKYKEIQKDNWSGQHYFEVCKIENLNEEIIPYYAKEEK